MAITQRTLNILKMKRWRVQSMKNLPLSTILCINSLFPGSRLSRIA
uniref:Alternative protein LONRF2 n=1 Tax=Homo sapiens TaxID=9606 RepID=L8E9U6_HUMAN|nr:alternative protein LONRF2 [Homo sapiens]